VHFGAALIGMLKETATGDFIPLTFDKWLHTNVRIDFLMELREMLITPGEFKTRTSNASVTS
jgi:hypothetical protein